MCNFRPCWVYSNFHFLILNHIFRHLSELRNLYLHNNKLEKIEGLSCLKNLTTLNLSSNAIGSLHPGSLSCLPNLHTLLLSRNKLRTAEDIKELLECTKEVKHLMIIWWLKVKRRSFQNGWIWRCMTSLLPFWALSQFLSFFSYRFWICPTIVLVKRMSLTRFWVLCHACGCWHLWETQSLEKQKIIGKTWKYFFQIRTLFAT